MEGLQWWMCSTQENLDHVAQGAGTQGRICDEMKARPHNVLVSNLAFSAWRTIQDDDAASSDGTQRSFSPLQDEVFLGLFLSDPSLGMEGPLSTDQLENVRVLLESAWEAAKLDENA